MCVRLRDKPCDLCPKYIEMEMYGRGIKGCYLLAEEACNVGKYGMPWRPRPGHKGWNTRQRAWRKRFNDE